jgi:flagellar hook-length control protein FliK
MTTNSLFLTPAAPGAAAPAAPGAAAPVVANPLTGGATSGQAVRDQAPGTADGLPAGGLGSFLQALQRSAVPFATGLAAPVVALVPVDGAAANDGPGEGADAGPDSADLSAAAPLPAWVMAGLVPVAAPALPADLGAGLAAAPGVVALDLAAAAASGAAPDLAVIASTAPADAVGAGMQNTTHAAALDAAPFPPPVAGSNAMALAQAAPLFPMAGPAMPQEPAAQGTAKPAGFTPPVHAGAPEALLGGSALGPEAAAVRERSTPASGLDKYVADANTLASGALNAPSPAHHGATVAATPAARAPSALLDVLGERIETQLQRGSERTVIRLDPPLQGQLEITVRRDAGAIQVHLSASNADVVRQLQAISDGLRQELGMRQGGDVSVVVSSYGARDGDARGGSGGRASDEQAATPGRALAEAQDGHEPERFTLSALSPTPNH